MPGPPLDCKVYVGDLGSGASKQELEDIFSSYGRLRNVWVSRNPPGFAFVEFEDCRDAVDAVKGLKGRSICGRRARIELSSGKTKNRSRGPPSRRGRPFHQEDRCYECGERGHYARDCNKNSRKSRDSRTRSRSRSPRRKSYSRSRSRDRSRSRSRAGRSRSRSGSRGAAGGAGGARSRSRERSASKGQSRLRSRSRSRGRERSRSNSRTSARGSGAPDRED